MVSLRIVRDEYWPFHEVVSADDDNGILVDIPDAVNDRWFNAMDQFHDVQAEMQAYYEGWAVVK